MTDVSQLQAAEHQCRQRLARNPDDIEALHALGLLLSTGQPAAALPLLQRCVDLAPTHHDARFALANLKRRHQQHTAAAGDYLVLLRGDPRHYRAWANLGNSLRDLGRARAALRCYARAARHGGHLPIIDLNRAVALHRLQRSAEALALVRQVQIADPQLIDAAIEEALILADLGDKPAAIACLDRVLQQHPRQRRARNSRGNLLASLYRFTAALDDFNAALALAPDFYEALNNRANLLRNTGRFGDALADYDRALALRPGLPQVLINRGNVLRDLGRWTEALESLQQAIQIDPRFAEAHLHAGRIHADLGQLLRALDDYDHAIRLQPELWEAWFYKGGVLRDLGRHEAALECFRAILDAGTGEVNLASLGNYLFSLNFDPRCSPESYLAQARQYGELVARRVEQRFDHSRRSSPPAVIRLGIVSGDLRHHPVGLFLKNVLCHLDPAQIQLYAYYNNGDHDAVSDALRAACAVWRVVPSLSDAALAQQIYDDGIDILIDLAGHTDKSRLPVFAWKPAPVQVSWLGYCASTGVSEIDYLLGDRIVTPLADQSAFVERIVHLPESYFCFSPPTTTLPVAPLPALARGHLTYGCFNKLSKMTDAVVAAWSDILTQVPTAHLMLKADVLSDPATRASTIHRFAAHGIHESRLTLAGASAYEDYLRAYAQIDIALDPFPYPGATTTLEGLWMGVPCITLRGDRFLARNGATIATHAGLEGFVATSIDDYIKKAVAVARHIMPLATLRAEMRTTLAQSALYSGERFAQGLCKVLKEILTQSIR